MGVDDELLDADDVGLYDYEYPVDSIAQDPSPERTSARLLDATSTQPRDLVVRDLVTILNEDDLLVVNDTQVMSARLALHRESGGGVEVLLLRHLGDDLWECLLRPSRKLADGDRLLHSGKVVAVVEGPSSPSAGEGRMTRMVRLLSPDLVSEVGELPLPPYIKTPLREKDRYQTVFARNPGSAAAPTAGLHLDEDLLGALEKRGVSWTCIDLTVGLGTFLPISSATLQGHKMHSEKYRVSAEVWEKITRANRVVAVGTTVVRTLESVALSGELEGETSLFIKPGFDFQVVDVLMTNFHTPRSTLLVLVAAFYGPRWKELYAHAIQSGYRLFSLGDAMLLPKGGGE